MKTIKHTLLASMASALINECFDSFNEYDFEEFTIIKEYIKQGRSAVSCDEPYYGRCEATGFFGSVCEYTWLEGGGQHE
jgi:hypothetical protein